ncbi:hypothetical protein PR202_gb25740 [Eleusine coracana subsp. coracana]|uniref:Uncharacterized protein n=1 Tax=Eleusine coracana subsp. coracana TaxID=191504 RepID=A0AAV5FPF4_ELECO|nr:hypothetical protein PR202_gb25740 [Eleusine coracana subsp. coracana]
MPSTWNVAALKVLTRFCEDHKHDVAGTPIALLPINDLTDFEWIRLEKQAKDEEIAELNQQIQAKNEEMDAIIEERDQALLDAVDLKHDMIEAQDDLDAFKAAHLPIEGNWDKIIRYAAEYVNTEDKKEYAFLRGMNATLKERLTWQTTGTYNDLVNAAIVQEGAMRQVEEEDRKRKAPASASAAPQAKHRLIYTSPTEKRFRASPQQQDQR